MTVKEMHDHLFEMLLVIDEICRDNHILYTLDGGTEIGAVREKDFIPWDDDMDICVLPEDYPAFREAMKKNLPEHLHLVEPKEISPYFYDFMIRIIDDRWLLHDETEDDIAYGNIQNHVCVDVVLYCGIPRSRLGQRMFFLMRRILHGMGMAYRYRIDWDKYSQIEKMQIKCIMILGKLYSGKTPDRIFRLQDTFLGLFDANKTGYRCSGTGSILKHYEKAYKNEWFQGTVDGHIRGRAFPIKVGYDQEMKCKYGNYMKPEYDPQKYVTHGVYQPESDEANL